MKDRFVYVLDDDDAKAARILSMIPAEFIGTRKPSIWECHQSALFPLSAVFIDMSALDCGVPHDIEQALHQIRALAKDRLAMKVFVVSEMPSSTIHWIEDEIGLPNVRAINIASVATVLSGERA